MDVTDLILKYLEELAIVYVNNNGYMLTDEYIRLVRRALTDPEIQKGPNPIVSSLILAYLYVVEKPSHEWEISQIMNVIFQLYKETVDPNAAI